MLSLSDIKKTEKEADQDVPEDEESTPPQETEFDAVDLMLHGNLQGQIRYSMIKGVAAALDEKVRILLEAEENFEPAEDEEFVEIAMPEIECMAQALTDEWIDFSKLGFWQICETSEVAWEEYADEEGHVAQRLPYGKPLEKPGEGNRILINLEHVRDWLQHVHQVHEQKGMGWVSPHGCPEDGQHAYDARRECIGKINGIIESIQNNFE